MCVCGCVRPSVCARERKCVCVRVWWARGDRELVSEREGTGFGQLQLDRYISQLECY